MICSFIKKKVLQNTSMVDFIFTMGFFFSLGLLINGFETTVWPYIYHGFLLGLGVFTLSTRHTREALGIMFTGTFVEQKSDFLYFLGYLATAVTLFVIKLVYLTADVHTNWPYKIIFAALIIMFLLLIRLVNRIEKRT